MHGLTLDEPTKEEVRVPRPLAKDTWVATHGEAQLHSNTDRSTIVRSIMYLVASGPPCIRNTSFCKYILLLSVTAISV